MELHAYFERLLDRRVGERRHDRVALRVRVQVVSAQLAAQQPGLIEHRREVVKVDVALGRRVLLHPVVDRTDPLHRTQRRLRPERCYHVVVADREDARQHDLDLVGPGQLRHRHDVALDLLVGHRAGVGGDVVGAGEDDDRPGFQVDDVGTETEQHLRRRLAADAPADVALVGREVVAEPRVRPGVGDRVAHEHDARLAGRRLRHRPVGVAIAGEQRPVALAGVGAHQSSQRGRHLGTARRRRRLRLRSGGGGGGRLLSGQRDGQQRDRQECGACAHAGRSFLCWVDDGAVMPEACSAGGSR